MKIFYLSGICPYPDKTSGGPFILQRIREILKKAEQMAVYSIIQRDSPMTKGLKKILGREVRPFDRTIDMMDFGSFKWNYLYIQPFFFEFLWSQLNPRKLVEKKTHLLLEKVDFENWDLIHAHWAFPEGLIAKHLGEIFKIPYIITSHGSDIHTLPQRKRGIRPYIVNALEEAQKAIFVSQGLLKRAIDLGYSGKNSVVISNGVDREMFQIFSKEETKSDLLSKRPVVGFVGHLIPVKRADKFPEIFSEIRNLYGEVEFLLVGEGFLRSLLEREFHKLKLDVHFTGSVSPHRVPHYMNRMNALILPSRDEGFGCVALEGKACGIPVVGTHCGGIPEALGNPNWVVEEGPNFERRFAARVVEILRNPPEPQAVRKETLPYDWKKIVQREWEVYEEVLKNWQKRN